MSIPDVVTAVINSQGILAGLYDEDEMHSENVKEKDAKIRYLDKLIDALSWALGGKSTLKRQNNSLFEFSFIIKLLFTGPPLPAKPSKIVSGQEPGKTNEVRFDTTTFKT